MQQTAVVDEPTPEVPGRSRLPASFWLKGAIVAGFYTACFYDTFKMLHWQWTAPDSYYLHAFLIPPVCLYFLWSKRAELLAEPLAPTWWGVVWVGVACLMLLVSELLGIRILAQFAMLIMLAGLVLAFFGAKHLRIMWFSIVFLLAMVPVPMSIVQGFALRIKLFATEMAVRMAYLLTFPVIRDGSYVWIGQDHFIVGEVCGGLRSLISLLSIGAVVAYIGKMKPWARVLLFVLSGPIAVFANLFRIFVLIVATYYVGSEKATGRFHDISGLLIFLVAFVLLFSLDSLLRRVAPLDKEKV